MSSKMESIKERIDQFDYFKILELYLIRKTATSLILQSSLEQEKLLEPDSIPH
jgi:hypothetical protein